MLTPRNSAALPSAPLLAGAKKPLALARNSFNPWFLSGALLLLLALLGGAALAESENLLEAEKIVQETANYKTETVRVGTYEKRVSTSAAEYYPYTCNLRFEGPGAKFVEYAVARGDEVRAGDVLAVFEVAIDEPALAGKELALARAREAFAEGVLEREAAIEELSARAYAPEDPIEREILALQRKKLLLEYENYRHRQERAIEDMEIEIAEIQAVRAENVLLAPEDGVIVSTLYKRPGDAVSASETLVVMYRTDGMLLRIDNTSGNFRFNMDVTIETGVARNRIQLTGRVVGADTALPETRRTGHAFIRIDPFDESEITLRNPSVSGASQRVDNVLLLPRRTTTLENGKHFVTKLTDGMVQKRYVKIALNNTADAWILQGVLEGETVVID